MVPPDREVEAAELRAAGNRSQEFFYSTGQFTLGNGLTLSNVPINVNSDSIFVCTSIGLRTDAGGALPMDTEISMRRGGSGALIMDRAVPPEMWMNVIQDGNIAATWSMPTWRYLSQAIVFDNNETILFDLADQTTGAAQVITIVLGGWKFYLGSRPGMSR